MAAHIDQLPPPTVAHLQQQWAALSSWYQANSLKLTSKIFRSFLDFLKVEEAKVIIEVACGPGNGIQILRSICPPETRILACDLCETFVSVALSHQFPNTEICVANAESLPYPSLSCDRYIANLALMLVTNPDQMLSEAYRVLQPGGLIATTVWGSKGGCTLFSTGFEALALSGIQLPPPAVRSNFHLSDPELLKSVFRSAGFPHPLVITELAHLGFLSAEEYVDFFSSAPEFQKAAESAGPDGPSRFRSAVLQLATKMLHEEGRATAFEAYAVIAQKPVNQ